jgi:hypothetical protein
VAFGQLPVAAPLVQGADLLLEASAARRRAAGRGGVVGGERLAVLAAQCPDIADRFVERRRLGMTERDGGFEMGDRLGAGQQRARTLAGGGVGQGRRRVLSGQLEMTRDDRRVLVA